MRGMDDQQAPSCKYIGIAGEHCECQEDIQNGYCFWHNPKADKRGPEFAVPLVYRNPDDSRFYIPANVYLIGLMNLADRSLAMVDYALRRRFAFLTLQPQYDSSLFKEWLLNRSMPKGIVDLISSGFWEQKDENLR